MTAIDESGRSGLDREKPPSEWPPYAQELDLASSLVKDVATGLVYFVYVRRNAWHSTWVTRDAIALIEGVSGGATWYSAVNRRQVGDAATILWFIVPMLVYLMLEHPNQGWGRPCYPVGY